MNPPDSIELLVIDAANLLREKHGTLATVESCTGGMVGAALTALPGISDVYLGGYITYSNQMKTSAVGVDSSTIERHGAVSAQVAIAMSQGGRAKALTTHALAITGIAGPDGGTDDKPVGTVWISATDDQKYIDCRRFLLPGDRNAVRTLAAAAAFSMLIQRLSGNDLELEHQHERYKV